MNRIFLSTLVIAITCLSFSYRMNDAHATIGSVTYRKHTTRNAGLVLGSSCATDRLLSERTGWNAAAMSYGCNRQQCSTRCLLQSV